MSPIPLPNEPPHVLFAPHQDAVLWSLEPL